MATYYWTEIAHTRAVPNEGGYRRTIVMERVPEQGTRLPEGVIRFYAHCTVIENILGNPVQMMFDVEMPDAPTLKAAFIDYDRLRPEVEKAEVEKQKADLIKRLTGPKILGPGAQMPPIGPDGKPRGPMGPRI